MTSCDSDTTDWRSTAESTKKAAKGLARRGRPNGEEYKRIVHEVGSCIIPHTHQFRRVEGDALTKSCRQTSPLRSDGDGEQPDWTILSLRELNKTPRRTRTERSWPWDATTSVIRLGSLATLRGRAGTAAPLSTIPQIIPTICTFAGRKTGAERSGLYCLFSIASSRLVKAQAGQTGSTGNNRCQSTPALC